MIANYHTHTARCGHAEGTEREYVEQAVREGLQTLGMSDHTPYDFYDIGQRDRPMRMTLREFPEYAENVRSLAAEFRGKIDLLLGVEAEYYPKYFPRLVEILRDNGIGYMILGQHFLGNEVGDIYCGRPSADEAELGRYVSQSSEAMATGLFTYFAHPDLFFFTGDDAVYQREMRRLCRAAKKADIPLEINLLGIREGRHYPNTRFWRIAAEEGNNAVLGCDAHQPHWVVDPVSERKALKMAGELGLNVLQDVQMRSLGGERQPSEMIPERSL